MCVAIAGVAAFLGEFSAITVLHAVVADKLSAVQHSAGRADLDWVVAILTTCGIERQQTILLSSFTQSRFSTYFQQSGTELN